MPRRKHLDQLNRAGIQHAGLWLDRYLPTQANGDEGVKTRHIVDVATLRIPDCYVAFYRNWRQAIEAQGVLVQLREAEVTGRMVVGLGGESVLETSIVLHRTYGAPYIPGSALKGLASAYAHQCLQDDGWRKGGDYHKTMFGTTETAGYVTFFDALYKPGTGVDGRPLHADVMAIHHKSYYDGAGEPPADWDSPTIVPFLSATGRYLVALGGPPAWVIKAFELLRMALKEYGVGAKTSSGYGRMTLYDAAEPDITPAPEAEAAPGGEPGTPESLRTTQARLGGVGAEDAAILPAPGIRPGRARFAPDLPRKPRSGDQVIVQFDESDRPVLIVAIVE